MPGDVIRRLGEGKDSQRGYVCDTRVSCHLQVLGTHSVVLDVDSRQLQPMTVSGRRAAPQLTGATRTANTSSSATRFLHSGDELRTGQTGQLPRTPLLGGPPCFDNFLF